MSISQKLHDELDRAFMNVNGNGQLIISVAGGNDLIPTPAVNDQSLTVDATAGGVQLSALNAATQYVFWTSDTADCRVTFDGSSPTASNGHYIPEGSSGIWSADLAADAKFIRTGTVSAVITATQMVMP